MGKRLETGNPNPDAVIENTLTKALNSYLTEVGKLDIVTEVIVGVKFGEPSQQLFNIAKEDFSLERAQNPLYTKLRQLGTTFRKELADIASIDIYTVNPSQFEGFLQDCNKRGIQIIRLPVPSRTETTGL